MTKLTKPVSRLTEREYSVLYAKPKQIIVTLGIGDVLEFRHKGQRESWSILISEAFRFAVKRKTGV